MNRVIRVGAVVVAVGATLMVARPAEAAVSLITMKPGPQLLPANPALTDDNEWKCLRGTYTGMIQPYDGTNCPAASGSWTFWHRGYVSLPWSRGPNNQAYAEWYWYTPSGSADSDWAARLVSFNFSGGIVATGAFNYNGGNNAGGANAGGATSQALSNVGDGALVLEIALRTRQSPFWPYLTSVSVRSYSE